MKTLYERLLAKSEQATQQQLSHNPETQQLRPFPMWAREAVSCPACRKLLEPGPNYFQCPQGHGGLVSLGLLEERLRRAFQDNVRLPNSSSKYDAAWDELFATFLFVATHQYSTTIYDQR